MRSHTHAGKLIGEYAAVLNPEFYRKCPKAVFAAIAVSFASHGGDYLSTAEAALRKEWDILHRAGIVPQRPPKETI